MVYWSVLALCRELVWIPHLGLDICIQKSGIRLGLVCFSFKEVRSYFRKVSGVVEMCGCGRSSLGNDVEHNKSKFQRGLIYLVGTCISTKKLLVGFGLSSPSSLASSQSFYLSRILREPSESSNSLPVLIYLILYFTLSATRHRTLPITPHSFYDTTTPITTHYNTYNNPSNSQYTKALHYSILPTRVPPGISPMSAIPPFKHLKRLSPLLQSLPI